MSLYESIKNNLKEKDTTSKDILEKIELYINKDLVEQIMTEIDANGDRSGWSASSIRTNGAGAHFLEISKNGPAPVDIKYVKKAILKNFPKAQVVLVDENHIYVYINYV